jgi:hypothetical protein
MAAWSVTTGFESKTFDPCSLPRAMQSKMATYWGSSQQGRQRLRTGGILLRGQANGQISCHFELHWSDSLPPAQCSRHRRALWLWCVGRGLQQRQDVAPACDRVITVQFLNHILVAIACDFLPAFSLRIAQPVSPTIAAWSHRGFEVSISSKHKTQATTHITRTS